MTSPILTALSPLTIVDGDSVAVEASGLADHRQELVQIVLSGVGSRETFEQLATSIATVDDHGVARGTIDLSLGANLPST